MSRAVVWSCGIIMIAAISSGLSSGRIGKAEADVPATGATDTLVLQQDLRGHYIVHPSLDGRTIRMLVDTGATDCALSEEDAAIVGIRLGPRDFTRPVSTANGIVRVAPIRIREIRVGGIVVRDVSAAVVPRGQLGTSLLGMSFLRRLKGFEMASGRLTLRG